MIRPLLCLLIAAAALPPGAAGARISKGAVRTAACGVPPALALSPGFKDPRGVFAPTAPSFRTLETRFASAYRLACRRGLLNAPFPAGPLLLKNAPDANTTSIYRDGEEGAASRPMVIEHPFVDHRGRVEVPTVEQLRSAIVCSAHNSNPGDGPVGDILECAVD